MTSRRGFRLGCLCAIAMFVLAGDSYSQDTVALVERLLPEEITRDASGSTNLIF
jgi:hypothetical protein